MKQWCLPPSLSELQQGGDLEIVKELLSMFRTDTEVRLQSLSDALLRQDYTQVKRDAHSLRGSSGQLGATSMAALCHRIESQADAKVSADLVILTKALDNEFERTWQGMALCLNT